MPAIAAAFDARYREVHGISFVDQPIECVDWKVEMSAAVHGAARVRFATSDAPDGDALKGQRAACFPPGEWHPLCPVYDRYRLVPDMEIEGPAFIEERESTVLLGPGDRAIVDSFGNLVVDIGLE
jgi:N-methylhydantoinase A